MRRSCVIAILLIAVLLNGAGADDRKIPILLDTDFGTYVDDAVALSLLLASPEVELLAVTTCGGDCEDRAWMVCRLLTMVDRQKIPVAWGREPQPKGEVTEMYQYRYHPAVLFNRTGKPVDKDAADLLYEKLKEQPKGETILLAIGPLTNVARLLEKHPDSKEMLKQIVVMGGAIEERKEAEWNIRQDVKAAQAVFNSGVPIRLVPLDVTEGVKLTQREQQELFAPRTMLTQQLQLLHQLSSDAEPGLFDAIAAACIVQPKLGAVERKRVVVDDAGFTRAHDGDGNVEVAKRIDLAPMNKLLLSRITAHGQRVQPRELRNFSKPVDRGGLPTRVHAFEDYETDIEKRWWLAGRLVSEDAPQGMRAMQSVLTLDFDDKQGDLKTMYGAVVFNPVPGPPMGPRTRLAFRYKLQGTDQLRVQLYSLSNGYHRYLALKDLPQDKWQEATVDMTEMRRPDGSGGALAEDERIDDIQFYVETKARVLIDDVVLYEASPEGEKQPFPQRIVFTGWFDTGKQGAEWPGDYEIVAHEKPRKWKAAKSVMNKELDLPWIRVSFRGMRPVGEKTNVRFKYRLTGGSLLNVQLSDSKAEYIVPQHVKSEKAGEWQETTVQFDTKGMPAFDELNFVIERDAELLIDDVLVYEPGVSQ